MTPVSGVLDTLFLVRKVAQTYVGGIERFPFGWVAMVGLVCRVVRLAVRSRLFLNRHVPAQPQERYIQMMPGRGQGSVCMDGVVAVVVSGGKEAVSKRCTLLHPPAI